MDVFLVGVPKAGTTWLSHVLDQHAGINLSDPKEPNFVATHKGTFTRDEEEPDWVEYNGFFSGNGLKMDASVHTFACPIAPRRIKSNFPDGRFILCLREPVSRTVSHWNMIRSSDEDSENDRRWDKFHEAWLDESLRVDSMYGASMAKWLEEFDLDRFVIIDSSRMKYEPMKVIRKIEEFLGIDEWDYDLKMGRHANSAASNRQTTIFGGIVRIVFSLIPGIVKSPIVKYLQKRDWNIYRLPLLSRREVVCALDDAHYRVCGVELCEDLALFENQTGFDVSEWVREIQDRVQ
jgi:hypothetical protein